AAGTGVIEEFLHGPGGALFALPDGVTARPLLPAPDFKRAGGGGTGPNTGGVGGPRPPPPTPPRPGAERPGGGLPPPVGEVGGGVLYAGLSLTAAGVRVVEFNARFGDPETQVVLDRLASPLAGLLTAAAAGSLAGAGQPRWAPGAAVTVVIAAEGYPAAPAKG